MCIYIYTSESVIASVNVTPTSWVISYRYMLLWHTMAIYPLKWNRTACGFWGNCESWLGLFWGRHGAANVTHNKTNLLSKTVTKWSQTCGNTVDIDILENGMRLSFFTTTIVKPTNPSKNEQYFQLFTKNPSTSKNSVCVCGKIASRYFSEYFQI